MIDDLNHAAALLEGVGVKEVLIKRGVETDDLLMEIAATANESSLQISTPPFNPSIQAAAYVTNGVTFYFV